MSNLALHNTTMAAPAGTYELVNKLNNTEKIQKQVQCVKRTKNMNRKRWKYLSVVMQAELRHLLVPL